MSCACCRRSSSPTTEIAEAVRRLDAACSDIEAHRAATAAPDGEADPHHTSAVLKGAA